jgi:hypothetical protein
MYLLIDNNLPMSALLAAYFYNYKIYFFLIIKENNIVDEIGKSPTPEGKIAIVLLRGLTS